MVEEKYKRYVDANFAPEDNFEKLAQEMELKDMKKNNGKHSNVGKYVGLGLSVAIVAGVAIVVAPKLMNKKEANPDKVVTLSLDNSGLTNSDIKKLANTESKKSEIQLTVDADGKVLSVYGNDNIAKLVLVDETLEGKDVNDALKTIIDVEINTGLIVKGNVSASANALEISVSAELSDEAKAYLTEVSNDVKNYLKENNVEATVKEVEGMVKAEIDAKVLEIDPTADVKSMSYEEKLKVISIHYIEVSSLYAEGLEDLYLDAKNFEIEFAEQEYTKKAIEKMTDLNGALKAAYLTAYEAFAKAANDLIDTINGARYEAIINPEGEFQVAYKELNAKLADLIKARNDLANSNGAEDFKLSAKIAAYNVAITGFEATEDIVNKSCDAAISVLNAAKEVLKGAEKVLFPDNLDETLTKIAKDSEKEMNKLKDEAFDKFEAEHAEDIKVMKQNLVDQKNALIEAIKAA